MITEHTQQVFRSDTCFPFDAWLFSCWRKGFFLSNRTFFNGYLSHSTSDTNRNFKSSSCCLCLRPNRSISRNLNKVFQFNGRKFIFPSHESGQRLEAIGRIIFWLGLWTVKASETKTLAINKPLVPSVVYFCLEAPPWEAAFERGARRVNAKQEACSPRETAI